MRLRHCFEDAFASGIPSTLLLGEACISSDCVLKGGEACLQGVLPCFEDVSCGLLFAQAFEVFFCSTYIALPSDVLGIQNACLLMLRDIRRLRRS